MTDIRVVEVSAGDETRIGEVHRLFEEYGCGVGCVGIRAYEHDPVVARGRTCEMKRLFVSASVRGRGVGEMMVRKAIDSATAAGYETMILNTIVPDMSAAVRIYRKLGFEDVQPYKDYEEKIEGMLHLRLEFGAIEG